MSRPLRLLLAILVVVAATCRDKGKGDDPARYGTVRVALRAAPTEQADQVWVTLDRVEALHEERGWSLLDESVRAVNLAALVDGVAQIVGLASVPSGRYTRIRIRIREGAVWLGDVEQPLTVPVDSPDGAELEVAFDVSSCGVTRIALDWDLGSHLALDPTLGYTLRPLIDFEPPAVDPTGCCADRVCAGGVCGGDTCEAGGGEELLIHDGSVEALSGYYGQDGLSLAFVATSVGEDRRVTISSATGERLIDVTWAGGAYRTALFDGGLVTTVDLAILEESKRLASLPPDEVPPFSLAGAITTAGDPALADALVLRPEYALLPYLSRALGAAGFNGAEYAVSLPVHRMGMQAGLDLGVSPPAISPRVAEAIPGGMCIDLRGDPNRDQCYGMCGPGCSCWQWVCGDCCCHDGCATHDSTCRNCKWYKPWNCVLCATGLSFLGGLCSRCGGGPVYEPPCVGIGGECVADYDCCGRDDGADEFHAPAHHGVFCEYDSSGIGRCRSELDSPLPQCGDGACNGTETCGDCASDCGTCPPGPGCGDGTCAPGVEDCATCGGDCPCAPGTACSGGACLTWCGNGACDAGETCGGCPADCGACPPGDPCGDGACDAAGGEACDTCPADCGPCPPPPGCGDGACDGVAGETCGNCASDCACAIPGTTCVGASCVTWCGNGACDGSEDCATCPGDCGGCPPPPPGCGNGVCDGYPEDCGTCPDDCPCPAGLGCVARMCTCGDGTCDPTEGCADCPGDCGACPYCGDGSCEPVVEDCGNCPGDCPCWMAGTTCVGGTCVTYCGNGDCDPDEWCDTCPVDCGSCCGNGFCDPGEDGCTCGIDCGPCMP